MNDIRQADYDTPLGNLVMRDGRAHSIERADFGTFEIILQIGLEPANLDLQIAALKRILPTATDDDIRTLKPELVGAIINRAQSGIPEAYETLGESSGASPEPGTNGSPPDSPTATSAPASAPSTG